jgi:hypothetical protein
MPTVRERRLASDFEKVQGLARNSGGSIQVDFTMGSPPHRYTITMRCRGVSRLNGISPVYRDTHTFTIELPAAYPSPAGRPLVTFSTPIFHPHVFSNQTVCLGSSLVGEYLDGLILRIGSLIQYDPQYFDFNSPANRVAAEWAKRNMGLFPLGNCPFKASLAGSSAITWTDLK